MTVLSEYAARVRDVCLDVEPEAQTVRSLGGDEWRWLRYRRMVRRRLGDTLRHAFPRLEAALGEEVFGFLEESFLAARTLTSAFIRDVPFALLEWLEKQATDGALGLPEHALSLARLEWAELAVAYAEDDTEGALPDLAMERRVVLARAHRLLAAEHAVHRFEPTKNTQPERLPTWLCVYREPGTHTVRVLETTAVTHALLTELEAGKATLLEAIHAAAAREGASVDAAFVNALADLLADLSERGVVLGGAP